jgi:hypothetical protein
MIYANKNHKNAILEFLSANPNYPFKKELEILFLFDVEHYSIVESIAEKFERIIKDRSGTLQELADANGWNSLFEHDGESYNLSAPSVDGFICRKFNSTEFVELPRDAKISRIF